MRGIGIGGVAILVLSALATFGNISICLFSLPRKRSLAFSIISSLVLFIVGVIISIAIPQSHIFRFARGLVFVPLFLLMFKGSVFENTFMILLLITLTSILTLFIEGISAFFTPFGTWWRYFSMLLMALALFPAYVFLAWRFGRQLFRRLYTFGREREWVLYSLGVIVSFGFLMTARDLMPVNPALAFQIMFFILVSLAVLCFAIFNTHEKTRQKYEADFARDIVASGREHYQKMNEQYEALRIMRHDYKFHLNTAIDLFHRGETEKGNDYLNGLKRDLDGKELPDFCDNQVINSLVADYMRRCAAAEITLDVSINMPDDFSISNYEMCIVLGNLLENAVEACQKLGPNASDIKSGRKIGLVIKPQGEQLALMVRNTFNGTVIKDGDQLVSTKKEGGIGLQSVKAVVERYGDIFYFDYDDQWFRACVCWGKGSKEQ